MKKQLLENVKTDTSGKWVSIENVEALVESVVAEAISAVEGTGKQCAYTTHDLIAVNCTIDQCVQSLKTHFGSA
jgi:hypothetical protein